MYVISGENPPRSALTSSFIWESNRRVTLDTWRPRREHILCQLVALSLEPTFSLAPQSRDVVGDNGDHEALVCCCQQ